MQQFSFLSIGKTKSPFFAQGIAYYEKKITLLGHEVEWTFLKEEEACAKKESLAISSYIEKKIQKKQPYLIALDERGKEWDSMQLSKNIQSLEEEGRRHILFILGGAFGISNELCKKAHLTLSLSKMTFPHEMARLIIMEQVYRALLIQRGSPYHHEEKY